MKIQTDSSTKLIGAQLSLCENIANIGDVTIREFLVYQTQESSGEFFGTSAFYKNNLADLIEETGEHLLNRMMLHFHHICMRAREVHVQHNFPNYHLSDDRVNDAMPANVNAITRVTFNEFSFYPYEKRGPLAFNELHAFCEKLEEAAREYPINMHVCVSSVPVYDQYLNDFNVCIYLQCGREPRLNVFSKAVPSDSDPIYDRTYNSYYAMIKRSDKYIKDVRAASFNLLNVMNERNVVTASAAVEGVYEALYSYPEFLLDNIKEQDDHADIIKYVCETILENAVDAERLNQFDFRQHKIALIGAVYDFTEKIEQDSKQKYVNFEGWARVATMPQANVGNHENAGNVIFRGGLIECVTAGGVEFITAVDICFDNNFDIAVKLYQRYLENCLRANKFISPYLSHIVTSNTTMVDVIEQPCDIVVQCDVNYSSIQRKTTTSKTLAPVDKENIIDTAFGPKSTIEAYDPYVLGKLANIFGARVEYYNKMISERRALALRVQRSPTFDGATQLDEFDKRASIHVMQPGPAIRCVLGRLLPEMSGKLESYESLFTQRDFIESLKKLEDIDSIVLGNSLLQWAVIHKVDEAVELIIENTNVDLWCKNSHGYSAFELAIMYGNNTLATRFYNLLIRGNDKAVTTSVLKYASVELKSLLLAAALEANRVSDVEFLLTIGADPFLLKNSTKPINVIRYGLSDVMFEVFYDYAKSTERLGLLSAFVLFNCDVKAKFLLLELCCRDRLDIEVDNIFKLQPDLFLTMSEIKRLHNLIDLTNDSELSRLVISHLNNLGYGDFAEELHEYERVRREFNSTRYPT